MNDGDSLNDQQFTELVYNMTRNDHLQLIVMPTEQCNFRCVYCYEDFSVGQMEDELVGSLINFIHQRCSELSKLEISWFGGEPLMGMSVIRRLMTSFSPICRSSTEISSSVTTNGYLLRPAIFEELLDLSVMRYQVTLDGPASTHDKSRPRRYGGGSFSQVWANLCEMQDNRREFEVLLRINVSPDNYEEIRSWVPTLTRFVDDGRFEISFQAVGRWGGPNDANLPVFAESDRNSLLAALRSLVGYSTDLVGDGDICYASFANSLVIRADGRIGKCTVALEDARNTVGHLKSNGTLELDSDKFRPWLVGLASGDRDALACPIRKMPVHPRALPLTVLN